jgi:hypothetical protein
MHAVTFGKPYNPARRVWEERAEYNYRAGGHELVLFVGQARAREVEAVRSGPIEFGFIANQSLLFLVRLLDPAGKSVMSFDCSYSWHRVTVPDRTLPPVTEDTSPELRASCTVIMVEATNGVVLVFRTVTFSPEFTRAIHRAITEQAARPYAWAECCQAVPAVHRFSTDHVWANCAMRCRGGD